jgi:CubicO group peptidase (beta-lactamase class C family)
MRSQHRAWLLVIVMAGCSGSHTTTSSDGGVAPPTPPSSPSTATNPSPPTATNPPVDLAAVDHFITGVMADGHIPGLSGAVVKRGQVVWWGQYGLADVEQNRPVGPDTAFTLASISKTFVATAVMQLVESGQIDLDGDVDQYLPFTVRNPSFPDTPITMRMLLTHTSSISEGTNADSDPIPGDPTLDLGGYLTSCFVPGGSRCYQDGTFSMAKPGTKDDYSNLAVSLAAYIVERRAQTPFERYTEDHIFGPLKMAPTGWHLKDLGGAQVAVPTVYQNGAFADYGAYSFEAFPAGALRTSALHLVHHLLAFMQGGQYDGVRILKPETVNEMRRSQGGGSRDGQGLIWYQDYRPFGTVMGHTGGHTGIATTMFFRPDTNVGVVILTNSDWDDKKLDTDPSSEPRLRIEARLWELADSL